MGFPDKGPPPDADLPEARAGIRRPAGKAHAAHRGTVPVNENGKTIKAAERKCTMIGSVLKDLLAERNMNVIELSRDTGISAQTLYSIIKRDNMKIDFDMLLNICRVLDVPVQVFYSADAPSMPDQSEWALIRKFRMLDARGRRTVETILDIQLEFLANEH